MPKTKKLTEEKIKKSKSSPSRLKYVFAVGRRKRSVARIKLYEGKGESTVNHRPMQQYFPGQAAKVSCLLPFQLVDKIGKYYSIAQISGGGKSSQLGAFIHALSRALSQADGDNRKILKENFLLRRDSREKERRKPGLAGKARKKKQSPKR